MQTTKLSILLLIFAATASGFHLSALYQNGMVLQAGHATVWGFKDGNQQFVTADIACILKNGDKYEESQIVSLKNDEENEFFFYNFEFEEGTKCDITFMQAGEDYVIPLLDVHFGDVWICSGQSNMEWRIDSIFNADEEVASMADYYNFRMFRLPHITSDKRQDDLLDKTRTWADTSDIDSLKPFSAVCLLTAKYMADVLGKDKVFGLIETTWGGTRIEAWMSPEALGLCGIADNIDENNPQNSNSYLYNAMIHPLVRMDIKGALWYQGEANAGWNRDDYQCTFPSMIESWRSTWAQFSSSSFKFPFGFMQLATTKAADTDTSNPQFPVIRWHQTADFGYVPNDVLQDVFMGVSLDTYDEENGIHPRNKQLPSSRLASAGLHVAYGLQEYPDNGPRPVTVNFNPLEEEIQIELLYDQDFTWNEGETNGFSYCCEADLTECNAKFGTWINVESVSVNGRAISTVIPACSVGLGYLWKTVPVLGTEALPIYAANVFKLPASPWIWNVTL